MSVLRIRVISSTVQSVVSCRTLTHGEMETRIHDRAATACGTARTKLSPAVAYGRVAVSLSQQIDDAPEVQPTC